MYSKQRCRLMTILAIFYLLAPGLSRGRGRRSHEKSSHGHHFKSPEARKPRRHASLMAASTDAPSEVQLSTKIPEVVTEIIDNTTTITEERETTDYNHNNRKNKRVAPPPASTVKNPVVTINTGKVRGKHIDVKTSNTPATTRQISRFLGIKFAEPPLGERRFKPPEKARPWTATVDALDYQKNCYQWTDYSFDQPGGPTFRGTEMWNTNAGLSEDCLYLNVWTPVVNFANARSLPVMVWIYGGGFYSGSSSLDVYDGRWLAAVEDVVVVSLNYRTAALGFLAYDDVDIKGNAGLYDQRMALQWVHDNIAVFGGDPDKVTLFGESAGAASVSMHLVSPQSNHLFRNVILQSGTLLSPWSILPIDEAHRRSEMLAEYLNCTTSPKYAVNDTTISESERKRRSVVNCFRNIPAEDLVNHEMSYWWPGTFRFLNGAVVSDDFIGDDPNVKLPKIPDNKNVLVGYNSNEGSYFLIYGSPGWSKSTPSHINEAEFTDGLKLSILNPIGDNVPDDVRDQMVTYAHFVYTQGKKPATMNYKSKCLSSSAQTCVEQLSHMSSAAIEDTFYRDRLDDMTGDVAIVCPLFKLVDDVSPQRPGKLFFYHFDQRSSQNPWPEWLGVMHGYEIEFVFGIPLDETKGYTSEEKALSRDMMKAWANFAKNGDPNSVPTSGDEWKEYDSKDRCIKVFSNINPSTTSVKSTLLDPQYSSLRRHCNFWNDYFPQLFKLASSNCSGAGQEDGKNSNSGGDRGQRPTSTPPLSESTANTAVKMSPLHGAAGRSYPMTLLILLSYHLFAMLMISL